MNLEHPFLVRDLPGYTPHVSRLLVMMNYGRETTLQAVKGLSAAQLDHLVHPEGNSIGMLLAHMAAVEGAYQLETFRGRDLTEAEAARWGAGLELGDEGRRELRGRDLAYYLGDLEAVRARTLREFAERDDAWLAKASPFWWGRPANNYFKWFHVFEDEINHRGQIRLIRKLLPPDL